MAEASTAFSYSSREWIIAGDLLGQPFLQYAQVGSRVVLGDECVDGLTVEQREDT